MEALKTYEQANPLKEASIQERLGEWTKELTHAVIRTCEDVGWKASAKRHRLELLPVHRDEYLGLDIMAFDEGDKRWRFPVAVMELENSKNNDYIAYSLWKVLSTRADLRIVFCYRRKPEECAKLVRFLTDDVIQAIGLKYLVELQGETVLVIGSRDESATFPYGFFKWWKLDNNLGKFISI